MPLPIRPSPIELVLQRADHREDHAAGASMACRENRRLARQAWCEQGDGRADRDDTKGGDANANLPGPSQAPEKRSPFPFF